MKKTGTSKKTVSIFAALAPKEKHITKAIRDYLHLRGHIFHFKVWQGLGSYKGVADIIGLKKLTDYDDCPLKHVQPFAIEIKTKEGKISKEQEDFLKMWETFGGLAFVARSVDDVMARGL